jgi:hypothetical protein
MAGNPATVAALFCRKCSAHWDILGVSLIFIPIRRDHACIDHSTVLDQEQSSAQDPFYLKVLLDCLAGVNSHLLQPEMLVKCEMFGDGHPNRKSIGISLLLDTVIVRWCGGPTILC